MKLQKTTLILLFLALVLGGFVYIYEIQGSRQRQEQKAQQSRLFQFATDEIQSLTITKPELTIRVERSNQDNQKWLLKSPLESPASNASVSYLVDLLVGQAEKLNLPTQNATITPSQLAEYGLDQPTATINIELKNKKRHQVILGKTNFNDTSLYAKTDTPNRIYLVSKDFANAVNRQIDEWKQPPPIPSPTVSPINP